MNIVVTGKSAAGKDSISKILSDNFRYTRAISATTRPKRCGETEGVDYYFLTTIDFDKKIEDGEFIEWAEYRGWKYGTLKSELSEDKNMIFVLNPNGLQAFKDNDIDFISFYIDTEDGLRVLRQFKRGDNDEEIERRFFTDSKDFREIKEAVDFIVNNDTKVDDCVSEILVDIAYHECGECTEEFLDKLEKAFEKATREID